jgi:hypothetical protein
MLLFLEKILLGLMPFIFNRIAFHLTSNNINDYMKYCCVYLFYLSIKRINDQDIIKSYVNNDNNQMTRIKHSLLYATTVFVLMIVSFQYYHWTFNVSFLISFISLNIFWRFKDMYNEYEIGYFASNLFNASYTLSFMISSWFLCQEIVSFDYCVGSLLTAYLCSNSMINKLVFNRII